jgi:hypothetical protein
MLERESVLGGDLVTGFPDQDDAAEQSDQAHGVEGGHECLGLLSVAFEHDEKEHANGDDSGRGAHDSQPLDEVPDAIELLEEKGSVVLGVEPEPVTLFGFLDKDPPPVHQIYIVGLMLVNIRLVGREVEHGGCAADFVFAQES